MFHLHFQLAILRSWNNSSLYRTVWCAAGHWVSVAPAPRNTSSSSPSISTSPFPNPPRQQQGAPGNHWSRLLKLRLPIPIWNQLRQQPSGRHRTLVTLPINISISLNTNDNHLHCLEINLSSNHPDYRVYPLIFQAARGNLIVRLWRASISSRASQISTKCPEKWIRSISHSS